MFYSQLLRMLRYAVCAFLVIGGLASAQQAVAREYAALVMHADTGEVLHSRRAHDTRYPASITKIMTLYMLFEAIEQGRLNMGSRLKVSRKAVRVSPSKLGLRAGSTIRVKDAIGTLITKSANDVAVAVAEALAGSEAKFAKAMTQKARALGMKETTFRNASGLHHRRQVTTAYDIAILAQRIRRDFPEFYPFFKMRQYTYKGQTFKGRTFRNHNLLLGKYPGMEGLKTGFINASGFNLVAVAKRNDQRIITVVFGGKTGKSRDHQVRKLMDLGFSRLPNLTVVEAPMRGKVSTDRATVRVVKAPPPRGDVVPSSKSKTPRAAEPRRIALQWYEMSDGEELPQGSRGSDSMRVPLQFIIIE